MINQQHQFNYSPEEEKINVVSHATGMVLSVIATVLLLNHAIFHKGIWHIVSFSFYGISMCLLFTASTLYHKAKDNKRRKKLKIFDHAAIYVLIAGTYTPFTLVTLQGKTGWIIFGITWGFAIAGICLKLFFTGKYRKTSTSMYLLMGWMIIFVLKPLITALPVAGLFWLLAGGISYTAGAVFYLFKGIKYSHAVFHILVLIGCFCHFITVYFFV